MKSTLIWLILAGAVLLLGDSVDAWNRQMFNRYSRNLFRKGGGGANDVVSPVAGGGGGNNEIDDFNALFGIDAGKGGGGGAQQQTEVYGIVEPLIEDTPCAERPCNLNEDCCPTGVCVNSYGEGKCIYVYGGRTRDICHRNGDCEPGLSCLKGIAGNLVCLPSGVSAMHMMGVGGGGGGSAGAGGGPKGSGAVELRQFGDDCVSSSDCSVIKGMCCQLQRSHHRALPKKMCAYFRDPFMCIDIMPSEDEEIRESRFLSSFSQRRM